MDKNKSRTDLLAAGRKKLQQFRQKKDSKGSKSSGKGGKSEHDSDADAKPAAVSLQFPDAEVRSVPESDAGTVDLPVTLSKDYSLATNDPLSVAVIPEMGTVTMTMASSDELPPEESGVDESKTLPCSGKEQDFDSLVSHHVESTNTVNAEGPGLTSSGNLKSVVSESTNTDLVGATKPVAIAVEAECAHGEDQGADYLASKQVDKSSGIELRRDLGLDLTGLSEIADTCAGTISGETSMKEPTIEVDQTNELCGVSASSGETNEVKDVWTMGVQSVSAVNTEVAVHQRGDVVASFFNEEKSEIPSSELVEADKQGEVVNVEGFSMSKDHSAERRTEGKLVSLSSDAGLISVSLSQLVEVLRRLDEEDFRLLFTSRELAADTDFRSGRSADSSATNAELRSCSQLALSDYQLSDVLERLKEQLYLVNLAKDVFLLQLDEQSELQMELDCNHKQLLDDMSIAGTLVSEVQGRNESLVEELANFKFELQAAVSAKEELEKQFCSAKAEVLEISTRANELHAELERSHMELSSLSAEIADCRALVASLQVENDILKGSLSSAVEEKKKLAEEKEDLTLGNEKLLTELAECKGSLTSFQVENVNLSGSLALTTEERRKLEEVKDNYVRDNEKLLTDLADCKALLEVLQVENANLNRSVTLATEERNKLGEQEVHFITKNDKLSLGLADCTKDATLHLEQLTEENIKLSSQSREAANQVEGCDMTSRDPECETAGDETRRLPREWETEAFSPQLGKPEDGLVDGSIVDKLKLDICDRSSGFEKLKGSLEEAEKIIQKLENAIEGMHSHSVSLSKSGGKAVAPGVSRLIQAFESKAHHDDHDVEEVPSTENQLLLDSFMLTKKQTINLRAVLKELLLDAENASELFKGERYCRILADAALGDLKVIYEAMKGHTNSSEAANVELIVLYEFIKQHLCDIEAKKNEVLSLYEIAWQQSIVLEAENTKLVKNLGNYQLCTSELERRLDEMRTSSDEMASSISNQVEVLHQEVAERAAILEQEWNSRVAQVVQTLGMLDSLIGSSYSTLPIGNHDGLEIGSRVAVSVDTAITVIKDLREKLEASNKDHEAMCSSYKDKIQMFNDLLANNELAIGVLHRIYGSLEKIVNDSRGHVEHVQIIKQYEDILDPLHIDNYDTLMEQLAMFLGERMQLESENNKLKSELTDKAKEMEELKKRALDSDIIQKLVEDVEGVVKLEGTGINTDKLESRLQSLISFLFEKYKEADEQVSLSRESIFCKEMESNKLQGQMDHLISLVVQQENEILILKESLRQGAEVIVAVQAGLQEKLNELEQSEQRVSSIREKLSMAVSKGKGLIVQRDNLKKSLAETSNELEKCSQELQLKDTRLQEVETKLKTYSEAGERVEALESELSYIRNSATALRESFLLKDSVLQRIEEILEDLDLPEHFHSRDIIEKVDWLARSVIGNSLPLTDWDQKSSVGGGSYSDAGFVSMDAWREENSISGDDLRRKYEELQSKFYGLAEQNEMLEQSLMERNNVVQRWEEILERINMPLQLRSMEPEDRIEWLGSALSEAHNHCNSLQLKVDHLETYCATLTAGMEESQKRLSDLETALQDVIREKEHLSGSLEIRTCDYDKVSDKVVQFENQNDKLQSEVVALEDKLVERERNQEHIEGEIRRLGNLVSDALQDSVTEDVITGGSSTECLERVLRKLVEKYTTLSLEKLVLVDSVDDENTGKVGVIQDEKRDPEDSNDQDVAVLKKELEEALSDLMCVKEEREIYIESNQSLVHEVEELDLKRQELVELLSQEEQKSASVREKLNVAVRKGKSLVQQRDSLKQIIEEVNKEVERLKSEINHRESRLSDYEQKIKGLSVYKERMEVLESESLFLRNRLAETEDSLHEKTHTLNLISNTLDGVDVSLKFNFTDPVEKLEQIVKQWHDLHAAVASSEHDSRKSKRAAELLLAELNEVQERNDGLLEELAKASSELSELSKERDLAEAAKIEAFLQVEKLSSVRAEERNGQFAEVMILKSCVDQLRKGFFDINDLIGNVLSKDLEHLHNLEASMMPCLEPSEAVNVVGPLLGSPLSGICANADYKWAPSVAL
ncbi:hypothetical protein U1Q18_018473 [Sarracenia purpurea var. burkii]